MKKFCSIGKAVLGLAFVLSASSCTTTNSNDLPIVADSGLRFHDESSVNAVLHFSSWDYTFLVQPKYIENGYLQQVRRDNIRGIFEKLNVRRGTAVVVVGWTYRGEMLDQLVADWK